MELEVRKPDVPLVARRAFQVRDERFSVVGPDEHELQLSIVELRVRSETERRADALKVEHRDEEIVSRHVSTVHLDPCMVCAG